MSKFYTTFNVFIRNMMSAFFNTAAVWVSRRQTISMPPSVSDADVARTLFALHAASMRCQAAIMVPDLFPGSAIETLFVPAPGGNVASTVASADLADSISVTALAAIGSALAVEMEDTGNDMVRYEFDNGSQAIAYLRDVRDTILKATNLVLLND
jgi:hypothetical protein